MSKPQAAPVRTTPISLTEPAHLPAIDADRIRLTQVLVNLLTNASQYTPLAAPIPLETLPGVGSVLNAPGD